MKFSKKHLIVTLIVLIVLILGFRSGIRVGRRSVMAWARYDVKQALKQKAPFNARVIESADMKHLPKLMQDYLEFTGVPGQTRILTVHAEQNGSYRSTFDSPLRPADFYQINMLDPLARFWVGSNRGQLGIPTFYYHQYFDGSARYFSKPLGLWYSNNITATEIVQAELVMLLRDMVWAPTAFLNDNLSWQTESDSSVIVTFQETNHQLEAELIFTDNRIVRIESERFRRINDEFVKMRFSTHFNNYQQRNGFRIPTHFEERWRTVEGEFVTFQADVIKIQYKIPQWYQPFD